MLNDDGGLLVQQQIICLVSRRRDSLDRHGTFLHDSSHKVRRQNTTEEELKRFLGEAMIRPTRSRTSFECSDE